MVAHPHGRAFVASVVMPLAMVRYGLRRVAVPLFLGKLCHNLVVAFLFWAFASWAQDHVSQRATTGAALAVALAFMVLVAYHTEMSWMNPVRTIWMDNRPRPPVLALHTWQGFSLGKWEGDMLTVETTHLKPAYVRRNGLARSEKATVRVKLDIIKGKKIPWMRIEKPNSIVAVYANRPLEVAVETATFHLMDWLITEFGFSPTDAYCLVSTCPDFRINVYQMCKLAKLSFVAGAEIPKRYVA